jgi:hypothetical protein
VAHGVFSEVAREGGSVMAGVPPGGGASGLAPSTIGFGEDAEVGTEVISKREWQLVAQGHYTGSGESGW